MTFEELEKVNAEIKKTPIKGKDYAEVPQKVLAFRKLFPQGTIVTELLSNENGVCVFKATALVGDLILGTGHAYEKENSSFINKTSYIENCETSAIGRCIGNIGIGLTEGLASFEEVQAAEEAQEKAKAESVQKALNDLRNMYERNGGKEWDKWLKKIAPDGMTNERYGREMARLKKKITDKAEK